MLEDKFYRPLGKTGLHVSPICLGTDNFANPTTSEESLAIINCAVDNGINLIDTANSYADGRSEEIIGQFFKESGRRDEIILTTKVYYPVGNRGINDKGASRKHIIKACEDSLRRLKCDYIDIYQTHRVCMNTPLEETLGALSDLRSQGKIRYAGSTTSPGWKITESSMLAEYKGFIHMVSEQLPYNLLDRRVENEILPAAAAAGLAVFVWSPLAMGLLSGRYDPSKPETFDTPRFNRGGIYAERITQKAAAVGQEGNAKAAPVWMLRLLGLFIAPVRETIEMLYEFDDDFVVDSSEFTAHFGMEATPLDEALAAVMAFEA